MTLEHAESFITALFDVCDDLGHTRSSMFELSPMMQADRIIYWYVRREPDAERRKKRTSKAGITALPTQTTPLTAEGTILGTLQYMYPAHRSRM